MRKRRSARRGATMVEFAVVVMLLLTVIFAGVEFDRMLMVYTALGNATRVGVRYAIVHGGSRTGAGTTEPPSGATDSSNVVTTVKGWAVFGMLNPNNLTVTVEYPASVDPTVDPGNSPGSTVIVTVTYPYDPLTFLPFSMNLSSTSRGIVVF